MPDRKVDRPCPPGMHRHGRYNYCHDIAVRHRAGPGPHGLRGETATRPRAKANPMRKVGEMARQIDDLEGAKSLQRNFIRPFIIAVEGMRGKVSHGVHEKLRRAAEMMGEERYDDAVRMIRMAIRFHEAEESKMRKAEEKRQDAKPEVPYEEDYAQIFEVESRLKAVRKALERMTGEAPSVGGILGELQKLEKRLASGCCG